MPRDPAAVKEFVAVRGSGERPVAGRDGGDPAGIVRVDAPGLLVVGYQSQPRSIELAPDTFDRYLGEEGLDEIRSLLGGAVNRRTPAREQF